MEALLSGGLKVCVIEGFRGIEVSNTTKCFVKIN